MTFEIANTIILYPVNGKLLFNLIIDIASDMVKNLKSLESMVDRVERTQTNLESLACIRL